MNRTDIADFLALTTETASRTITQLKTDGPIRLLSNNKIEICSGNALAEIAEGF